MRFGVPAVFSISFSFSLHSFFRQETLFPENCFDGSSHGYGKRLPDEHYRERVNEI